LLPKKFEKWYTAKTPISLIPIGHVTGIHSENLFYPLKMTAYHWIPYWEQ
jgi:thiamine pyrophosphokinase